MNLNEVKRHKRSESHDAAIVQCSSSSSNRNRFSELSQDVMLAILCLVPLNCLLNSARYVSKHWSTAIPSCLQLKPPGLYVENIKSGRDSYFLDHVNGQKFRFGMPSKLGTLLDTCHGILLLHKGNRLTFAVNPILKSCFKIPIYPTHSKRTINFRSTIARVPNTAQFKLFLIDVLNVEGVDWYVFYVLRIGVDHTWKEIATRKQVILEYNFLWKPVYNGENHIYWITNDGVIVMDVDREILIGEYPLPSPPVNSSLWGVVLWMGDRLSWILTVEGISSTITLTYQIYTLDFDLGKWNLYHEMGPFDYEAACGHKLDFDNIKTLCAIFHFWFNDQIFFTTLIYSTKNRNGFSGFKRVNFCYNVKTRELTKIDGIAVGNYDVWLHTNTLVSLPSAPT